jgi:hypothetical protein
LFRESKFSDICYRLNVLSTAKKQPVSDNHNLFDLFGPTSLSRWERLVSEGEVPSKQQLADILETNAGEPLPGWLIELVAKGLRGELKQRAGRPKQSALLQMQFSVAEFQYSRVLQWLQKREQTLGLVGWSILQRNNWWQGPPHERAARIVTARWLRHMNWRTFLNKLSSRQ